MVKSSAAGRQREAAASEEVPSTESEQSEDDTGEELDDEVEKEGLAVTKAHTSQFASAHAALRETGAQFFVACCGLLIIPSLMELQVVTSNGFGQPCGIVPDLWLTFDGGLTLVGVLVSVYLHCNRHIISDRRMSEYSVRKARGDVAPPVDEAFAKRLEEYAQVNSLTFVAILACITASVVSWLVGSIIYFFWDLRLCDKERFAIRMIFWFRLLLPLLVLCCIIPIQHFCCEISLLSSVTALDGLGRSAVDSEESLEDEEQDGQSRR